MTDNATTIEHPEREMARRALLPGALVAAGAFGVGYLVNGLPAAVSALCGVAVVTLTFVAYAFALGRARQVSPTAVQAVALGGWLVRIGLVFGLLLLFDTSDWLDVAAFGFALIAGALAVAVWEAKLVMTGFGTGGGAGTTPTTGVGTARSGSHSA